MKKFSSLPLVIITFANMFMFGFLSSTKGVSFPLIKSTFNASYESMGLMSSLSILAALCFCLFAGVYMNRFGLKMTLITGFSVLMLGSGSLYFASSFWIALVMTLISQAGFGFTEIAINGMGVRIFTVKSALMLNFLHFFYGVGSIVGPRFMSFMINGVNLTWQEACPFAVIPVFITLLVSLAIRFPGKIEATAAEKKPSFWSLLKDPMVWLFGFILAVSNAVQTIFVMWSGIYFMDVYGLDPSTFGAAFVSTFYVVYSLSRFLSGFVIEKIGYMRSIFGATLIIIAILIVSFALGRKGIFLLVAAGFFIAIIFPTLMAISVGVFGNRAQTASSAMILISFSLNGLIQYIFGLSNRHLGAVWAYRTSILYTLILAALIFILGRQINRRKNEAPQPSEG